MNINAAEKTHIREQKLTLEIAAAKKQRDHYLSNIEKSRALKHIQERRKKVRHILHTYNVSKFACVAV